MSNLDPQVEVTSNTLQEVGTFIQDFNTRAEGSGCSVRQREIFTGPISDLKTKPELILVIGTSLQIPLPLETSNENVFVDPSKIERRLSHELLNARKESVRFYNMWISEVAIASQNTAELPILGKILALREINRKSRLLDEKLNDLAEIIQSLEKLGVVIPDLN